MPAPQQTRRIRQAPWPTQRWIALLTPDADMAYNGRMKHDLAESNLKGIVCILLTLVGWASVPLFLKHFASHIDAWTANGWRYGISAVFWFPVLMIMLRRSPAPVRLWRAALVPSLFNCLGQVCFAWAPYYIQPGLLTFLLRFQIVFVTAATYLLFPAERGVLRSPRYWSGLVLVFCGSMAVLWLGTETPKGGAAFGIFLGILAGVLYGGYALSVRHYMHRVHPVMAFAAISQYTAGGMVALMLILGHRSGLGVSTLSSANVLLLVISAFVGIALGHVFYYASIARLGVAMSQGIVQLQPVITATFSYFLFHEYLTAGQWTGGFAAMFGAMIMLGLQGTKRAPADQPVARDHSVGAAPRRSASSRSNSGCSDSNLLPIPIKASTSAAGKVKRVGMLRKRSRSR